MEEQALQQAVETFLQNPTWAEYYDNAPSGAKEVIALEFYGSTSQDAHNDQERKDVLKEVLENLDDEDKAYLAENSPNPNERAFYRKMIDGSGAGATGASGATGAAATGAAATGASGATGGESGATWATGEPQPSTGATGIAETVATGETGETGAANTDLGASGASGAATTEPVQSTGASGAVNNATA